MSFDSLGWGVLLALKDIGRTAATTLRNLELTGRYTGNSRVLL